MRRALLAIVLALAGCGGGDDAESVGVGEPAEVGEVTVVVEGVSCGDPPSTFDERWCGVDLTIENRGSDTITVRARDQQLFFTSNRSVRGFGFAMYPFDPTDERVRKDWLRGLETFASGLPVRRQKIYADSKIQLILEYPAADVEGDPERVLVRVGRDEISARFETVRAGFPPPPRVTQTAP